MFILPSFSKKEHLLLPIDISNVSEVHAILGLYDFDFMPNDLWKKIHVKNFARNTHGVSCAAVRACVILTRHMITHMSVVKFNNIREQKSFHKFFICHADWSI